MNHTDSTAEQAIRIRHKSGLTQTEFGKVLGVVLSTVQRWEVSGMPPLEYHHARMLYDDEYAASWIVQQFGKRKRLRPLVLLKLSKT